jgi:hypothetical protein
MGILTRSAQGKEFPRGVSFQVIGMEGVPGTSFVGLGYLIPNSCLPMRMNPTISQSETLRIERYKGNQKCHLI